MMIHNTYLIKALDCFPYAIEECVESLNYALAYDDENAVALCLMGRIQSEFLKDHENAKHYFQQALVANNLYCETYSYFIETLCLLEEYEEALRLIDFAFKIKGINKSVIYFKQAQVFDKMQKYKKALSLLDEAILHANDQSIIAEIEQLQTLIERKQKQQAKSKKDIRNGKKKH